MLIVEGIISLTKTKMIYGEHLKSTSVSFAGSGDNTVISAPTSPAYLAIDLLSLVPNAAVSLKLIRGTTDLTGVYSLTANQGFTLDNTFLNPDGVITCLPGEAFKINLSGAVQVSGFCRYRIISA